MNQTTGTHRSKAQAALLAAGFGGVLFVLTLLVLGAMAPGYNALRETISALVFTTLGLAQRINALPTDYRTSAYAVLGLLKREAVAIELIRRDMDALLSWLPLIDTAPPEDFEGFLRGLFSPQLWSILGEKERRRLVPTAMEHCWFRSRNVRAKRERLPAQARRCPRADKCREPVDGRLAKSERNGGRNELFAMAYEDIALTD